MKITSILSTGLLLILTSASQLTQAAAIIISEDRYHGIDINVDDQINGDSVMDSSYVNHPPGTVQFWDSQTINSNTISGYSGDLFIASSAHASDVTSSYFAGLLGAGVFSEVFGPSSDILAISSYSVTFELLSSHEFSMTNSAAGGLRPEYSTGGDTVDWTVIQGGSLSGPSGNVFAGEFEASSFTSNISGLLAPGQYTLVVQVGVDARDFQGVPSGLETGLDFNFQLTEVAAVPVPAAAWLFASGLLGLISIGRKYM